METLQHKQECRVCLAHDAPQIHRHQPQQHSTPQPLPQTRKRHMHSQHLKPFYQLQTNYLHLHKKLLHISVRSPPSCAHHAFEFGQSPQGKSCHTVPCILQKNMTRSIELDLKLQRREKSYRIHYSAERFYVMHDRQHPPLPFLHKKDSSVFSPAQRA